MIEQLPKDRWHELDLSEFGETEIPDGEVYVYAEDGKILGWYLVERNQTHVGPFHVTRDRRGNGIGSALAQHAYDTLGSGYYVSATTLQTKAMCESHGMTEIEGVWYVQQ